MTGIVTVLTIEGQLRWDWNLSLNAATLFFTVITSICIVYLTFLMLRFATRPRLRFTLVGADKELALLPNQVATLKMHIQNVGYWFARPKATDIRVYWNFESTFDLIEIRFGSVLEKTDQTARIGKEHRKYLKAGGVHLSAGEPGEYIEIELKTPMNPGVYKSWVSAFCNEGDCGVHTFSIKVR